MARNVPHVVLTDFTQGNTAQKEAFIQTLGKGLVDFGFVTVSSHGIAATLIEQVYQAHVRFFDLPASAKNRYDCVTGGARGYTPFGREQAKDAKVADLKEFFHVGQSLAADHPLAQVYPANVWPEEIPDMEILSLDLYRAMERVAGELLQALALYFHLPTDTFRNMIQAGDSILRSIHYPPVALGVEPAAMRAAAHEDINLITLLIESKGQGLQILTREGNWLDVDALQGDIVVDSGDMLSRICNGIVPATTHRVINPPDNKNESRYSMPFFVHPYPSCDLTVMEAFVSADRPAQWPPITAGDFLTQRLREIGLLPNPV